MSILIEGMETPKEIDPDVYIQFACGIDGKRYARLYNSYQGGITEWCEVIHIPPHGRLGDLDELYTHLTEWYLQNRSGLYPTEAMYIRAMLAGIADAPTIIPAEEGET